MPSILFDGRSIQLQEKESVLDALLRDGHALPYSCKAGSCGTCMMRAVEGELPAKSQFGLKDSWKEQRYFMPCSCHPETDLSVATLAADTQVPARLIALDPLSANVTRVRLACDAAFEFRPGQYLSLFRPDGLARSYSIASLPEDGLIELHVRILPNGRMSGWLRDGAQAGDSVRLLGPSGDCFYVSGREDQPLLLIGTGTGLAPLYGILRDALQRGHRGPIRLFHGAVTVEGLYLVGELRNLASLHPQFVYTPAVLDAAGTGAGDILAGSIDQVVLQQIPDLTGWRAFICGDPELVQKLRKKVFLAGAASKDIHADAFLPAG